MIWLSTVWPVRGPMCQRLANTARPSSITPRMTPSSTSVRLARMTRGSRNSGTPLAIASTPVNALQPAEKALRMSRNVTAFSPSVGSCEVPSCFSFEPEGVDEADGDDGEQPDDEHHGRQQEGAGRLAETPQVEQRDEGQDPEAQGDGGAESSDGKADCSDGHPGGDRDGHGERVVDDQRGRGDEAGVRAQVGPGDRVGTAAGGVGVDDLAVREDQDRQQQRRWRW